MSKASEYADKFRAAERAAPPNFNGNATVSKDGNLIISTTKIAPEIALQLAAWIVDVFGEPELDSEAECQHAGTNTMGALGTFPHCRKCGRGREPGAMPGR